MIKLRALGFGLREAIGSGEEGGTPRNVAIVSANRWLPSGPSNARVPNLSKDTRNLDFNGGYSNIITPFFLTGCKRTFGEPNKTHLWMSDQQRPLIKTAWLQIQLIQSTHSLIYSTHIHSYCVQSICARHWRKPQLAGRRNGIFAIMAFEIRHPYYYYFI